MDRRRFIRVVGGGAILAATATGCSTTLPAAAVQAWQGPAEGEADLRRWALGWAVLAPHSHNLQSWRVDLRVPGEILLYCDLGRLLPETDPFSRQIMMSHGTFLEVLDLAARQRGHRAEVTLFPQGEFGPKALDARPVARVRFMPEAAGPDPLFAQIRRRHTNREAYAPREPATEAVQAIAQSVAPHAVKTGVAGGSRPDVLAAHRKIAAEAWRIELETPRTIMESYRLLRVGPEEIARHRDGLTINTPLLRAMAAVGMLDRSQAPGPDDYATTSQVEKFEARLEATPAFFWMTTPDNGRRTQVNAGRAYVRAQLAATAHGLAMQPLSQALQEYPEQEKPYARIHALLASPGHTVQMWARLGYGPEVGPSPRRGVDAHVMAS